MSIPKLLVVLSLVALTGCGPNPADQSIGGGAALLGPSASQVVATTRVNLVARVGNSNVTSVAEGATLSLVAQALDAAGRSVARASYCWTSTDPAVIPVPRTCGTQGTLNVRAGRAGSSTIGASVGTVRASVAISVVPPPPARLAISVAPSASGQALSSTMLLGQNTALAVEAFASTGARLTPGTICWSSSDAEVVELGSNCTVGTERQIVRARRVGTATITGAQGSVRTTITIRVNYASTFNEPVILLHGLWSTPDTWQETVIRLRQAGWSEPLRPIEFSGPSSTPAKPAFNGAPVSSTAGMLFRVKFGSSDGLTLAQQGAQVSAAIDYVRRATGAPSVVLVGHSMGGLAARAYLQSTGYSRRRDVAALMTIGTPHSGSLLTYVLDYLSAQPFVQQAWMTAFLVAPGLTVAVTSSLQMLSSQPSIRALRPDDSEMIALARGSTPFTGIPTGPRYLNVVGSLTEASILSSTAAAPSVGSGFLTAIARAGYSSGANVCSASVQANWSDGIVPVCSQTMLALPIGAGRRDISTLTVAASHMMQTSAPEVASLISRRAWR